jgi:hypothetical protein
VIAPLECFSARRFIRGGRRGESTDEVLDWRSTGAFSRAMSRAGLSTSDIDDAVSVLQPSVPNGAKTRRAEGMARLLKRVRSPARLMSALGETKGAR